MAQAKGRDRMTVIPHDAAAEIVKGMTAISGGKLTGRGLHYNVTGPVDIGASSNAGFVSIPMKLNTGSVDTAKKRAGIPVMSQKHLKASTALTAAHEQNHQGWKRYASMLSKTGPSMRRLLNLRDTGNTIQRTLEKGNLKRQMDALKPNHSVQIKAENLSQPVQDKMLEDALSKGAQKTAAGLEVKAELAKKAQSGVRSAFKRWEPYLMGGFVDAPTLMKKQ